MAHVPDTPDDPGREAELAARGRSLIAAAVAETHAALGLRERLEGDRQRSARPARHRRLRAAAVMGGVVALAAILVALLVPGGSPGAPSIVEAARIAVAPAQRGAPAVDPAQPRDLALGVEGIAFPSWRTRQWRATGVRQDEADGQPMTTVRYRTAQGADVTYSIVAGPALQGLDDGRTDVVGGGVEVRSTVDHGRSVITWQKDGHTCIVTAPVSVPLTKLLELPATV